MEIPRIEQRRDGNKVDAAVWVVTRKLQILQLGVAFEAVES